MPLERRAFDLSHLLFGIRNRISGSLPYEPDYALRA